MNIAGFAITPIIGVLSFFGTYDSDYANFLSKESRFNLNSQIILTLNSNEVRIHKRWRNRFDGANGYLRAAHPYTRGREVCRKVSMEIVWRDSVRRKLVRIYCILPKGTWRPDKLLYTKSQKFQDRRFERTRNIRLPRSVYPLPEDSDTE